MSAAGLDKDLLTFLGDPRSYPDRPRHLRIVQTHSSYVVLTGQYVYKVKKPVNFGFLDFSTLEKRRQFCERETALNRRLCPAVYLGVVPVSLDGGKIRFGTEGQIIEYAVKMRRLPERFFLVHLVDRGTVTTRDVDAVIATLKPFYEAQSPTPEISRMGRIPKLRVSTDENFQQAQSFVGVTITRPALEAIRHYTNLCYRRQAALFADRVRQGRILDCHGDLHLEHIHLRPERVTIFDCIEFNDRLRHIDVASDVAFLAMDFDFHGRADLAKHFSRRMATTLGDAGMLRLLGFYKCYRAFVRGKVESLRQAGSELPDAERGKSRERALRYFELSLRYAVCGSEPFVLVAMGRVGSGKSTLARALGRELGWAVVSSDHLRKELAGVPLYERGGAEGRRALYGKKMSDKTYAALGRRALERVRGPQGGAVLDATFSSQVRRDALRRLLERGGVSYCFIEIQASPATVATRLREREHSQREVSDARLEDLPVLDSRYEPPDELDPAQLLQVRTARDPEPVVTKVLKALAQRRASSG